MRATTNACSCSKKNFFTGAYFAEASSYAEATEDKTKARGNGDLWKGRDPALRELGLPLGSIT